MDTKFVEYYLSYCKTDEVFVEVAAAAQWLNHGIPMYIRRRGYNKSYYQYTPLIRLNLKRGRGDRISIVPGRILIVRYQIFKFYDYLFTINY